MSTPRCLLIGAGCMAGGFVAPLLRDAGWEIILVSRSRSVVETINEGGGLWVRTGADLLENRWVGGISAVSLWDPGLPRLAAGVDLLATAVGSSALSDMGRTLAPLLRARLATSEDPINVITFENHRRAGASGRPPDRGGPLSRPDDLPKGGDRGSCCVAYDLAPHHNEPGHPLRRGRYGRVLRGRARLDPWRPPLDGSVPGIELVRAFDDRMIEKLWTFNAGHAAAAYPGWQCGCRTVREAMERPTVRAAVAGVVTEAQQAVEAYLGKRPGSVPLPPRSSDWILDSYANPRLDDPIVRVAREPRRKLAADDRLTGPGIACLAAGFRPLALADAMAAALSYAEPNDPQAPDLQREIELLGAEGFLGRLTFGMVS